MAHRADATHARKTRAYRIIKKMATEAGYMAHGYDVAGYEQFCDMIDGAAVVQMTDPTTHVPLVRIETPPNE